jgi:hypothetical protein
MQPYVTPSSCPQESGCGFKFAFSVIHMQRNRNQMRAPTPKSGYSITLPWKNMSPTSTQTSTALTFSTKQIDTK